MRRARPAPGRRQCARHRAARHSATRGRGLAGAQQVCREGRQLVLRDDPERPEADPGRGKEVGFSARRAPTLSAIGRDDPQGSYGGGDAGQAAARAMGAGRDGTGDGLRIDIAEIGRRQAQCPQDGVEIAQPGAGEHPDDAALPVGEGDPGEAVQIDQQSVGQADGGERMPRPDGLDAPSRAHGIRHRGRDLLGRLRCRHRRWSAALVARPVAPLSQR